MAFTRSTRPWTAAPGRPPKGLVQVAETFVSLQEERHAADYDIGRNFIRTEALALVAEAKDAFRAWDAVKGSVEADAFLVALLTKRR